MYVDFTDFGNNLVKSGLRYHGSGLLLNHEIKHESFRFGWKQTKTEMRLGVKKTPYLQKFAMTSLITEETVTSQAKGTKARIFY